MQRRILLLGHTGLEKRAIANACKSALVEHGHDPREIAVIDFERDYLMRLPGVRTLASYLQKPMLEQADDWNAAWKWFAEELPPSKTILLSLHGTSVRDYYGVRIAASVERICSDFDPTLVITLADDVYFAWNRTEYRAKGDLAIGRPTLEQLLMARRTEAMVGDLIQRQQYEHRRSTRHFFLSSNHPVSTFANIALNENTQIVYLSFPISAPREWEREPQDERNVGHAIKAAINQFHRDALAFQQKNPTVAFISPLAIDELPFTTDALRRATTLGESHFGQTFDFDVATLRWSLDELWGQDLLSPSRPTSIANVPLRQVTNVAGVISSNLGWRDYRLTLQADYVACFSPVVPRPDGSWRPARGVAAELEKASAEFTPCYVYQPPEFDPTQAWTQHVGKPGSMDLKNSDVYVRSVGSVQDIFDSIVEHARQMGRR